MRSCSRLRPVATARRSAYSFAGTFERPHSLPPSSWVTAMRRTMLYRTRSRWRSGMRGGSMRSDPFRRGSSPLFGDWRRIADRVIGGASDYCECSGGTTSRNRLRHRSMRYYWRGSTPPLSVPTDRQTDRWIRGSARLQGRPPRLRERRYRRVRLLRPRCLAAGHPAPRVWCFE